MGNAPPEGLAPKDDAEAARWAAEDAEAMRMPRYVPVASLGPGFVRRPCGARGAELLRDVARGPRREGGP